MDNVLLSYRHHRRNTDEKKMSNFNKCRCSFHIQMNSLSSSAVSAGMWTRHTSLVVLPCAENKNKLQPDTATLSKAKGQPFVLFWTFHIQIRVCCLIATVDNSLSHSADSFPRTYRAQFIPSQSAHTAQSLVYSKFETKTWPFWISAVGTDQGPELDLVWFSK